MVTESFRGWVCRISRKTADKENTLFVRALVCPVAGKTQTANQVAFPLFNQDYPTEDKCRSIAAPLPCSRASHPGAWRKFFHARKTRARLNNPQKVQKQWVIAIRAIIAVGPIRDQSHRAEFVQLFLYLRRANPVIAVISRPYLCVFPVANSRRRISARTLGKSTSKISRFVFIDISYCVKLDWLNRSSFVTR